MIKEYYVAVRHLSRNARLFYASASLFVFVFSGVYLVLFNLYMLRLGFDIPFIGFANALGTLTLGFVSLPAGIAGGRWGNRIMMLLGIMFGFLGPSIVSMVELVSENLRSAWILAANSLGWMGFGLFITNENPYLMKAASGEVRNHAFSLNAAIMPLTGFVGGIVGGFLPVLYSYILNASLDQAAPFRFAILTTSILLIPSLLAMLAAGEEHETKTFRRPKSRGTVPFALIGGMALFGLLRMTGEGSARTFFNVYLDAALRVPPPLIGLLIGTAQLLGAPVALAVPRIAKRWGKLTIIFVGIMGIAICLVPLALIPHWIAAGIGLTGVLALGSLLRPAFNIYSQELVTQEWRSIMSGSILTSVAIGTSAMTFAGGYLIKFYGYLSLFLTGAALSLAAGLTLWLLTRHRDVKSTAIT